MKQNEKAFPLVDTTDGMDLRDYFAAKAMQTILAHRLSKGMAIAVGAFEQHVSVESYEVADAMLKSREV